MNTHNEPELIRLLFTLADIEKWISDLTSAAISQVPHMGKKKLQKHDYYLGISTLAHILERHYHKIQRHPGAAKFCIPLSSILWHIKQAKESEPKQAINHSGHYRIHQCDTIIGYDQQGNETGCITVFTDIKGNILTAFPGIFEPKEIPIKTNEIIEAEEMVGLA